MKVRSCISNTNSKVESVLFRIGKRLRDLQVSAQRVYLYNSAITSFSLDNLNDLDFSVGIDLFRIINRM